MQADKAMQIKNYQQFSEISRLLMPFLSVAEGGMRQNTLTGGIVTTLTVIYLLVK